MGSQSPSSRESDAGTGRPEESPLPPGPDGHPFVGNTVQLVRDPFGFFDTLADHGDVVRYTALGRTFTALLHPDHVERVLVEEPDRFRRFLFSDSGFDFAPEGVLFNDDERGDRQRKLMRPAFTMDRIRSYADTMTAYAERTAGEWEDGREVALNRAFSDLTLRILAKALFDVDVDPQGDDEAIVRAARTINEVTDTQGASVILPDWVPTPTRRRYRRSMDRYRERVDELIDENRDGDEGEDLLSILVHAEGPDGYTLSESEVRDNLITFLFAGHETSSLALTYTFLLLAQHDDAMGRVREEVATVVGEESPGFEHVPRLEYTDRVIREAMRLYPPAFAMWREATEAVTVGGYRVPEGTLLTLPQFRIHRDGRFYDAPDEFRPDRWTDDDRPEYAYFPFGGGPRHCIGMRFAMLEMKLVVAVLARRFDVTLLSDPDPDLSPMATLHPAEDVRVGVDPR